MGGWVRYASVSNAHNALEIGNVADRPTTAICAFDRRRIIKCIQLDVLKDKIQLSENRMHETATQCGREQDGRAEEKEREWIAYEMQAPH